MIKFNDEFLNTIKARIPASSICARKVKLTKRGREYIGLSPFNSEKTPSFTVNDEKGFYHCFSSGNHGDIFRFLMEVEGYSFFDAVKYLADMAGLPLPESETNNSQQYKKIKHEREQIYDVLKLAKETYKDYLYQSKDPALAKMLANRKLTKDQLDTFSIGFAPNARDWLINKLKDQGVGEEILVKAGLAVSDKGTLRDRMINRLIFPIHDDKGTIVAFGGRRVGESNAPKYLNSPETTVFHKSDILYNFYRAKNEARRSEKLIFVEGYLDVMSMHSAGLGFTVAPLGTAINQSQLKLAWRVVDAPILCMDGDDAGNRAAIRAMKLALELLKPGKSLRFAFLPAGNDPDDIIKSGNFNKLKQIIDNPVELNEVLWNHMVAENSPDTPEKFAKLESSLQELNDTILDPLVKNAYKNLFRNKLWELRSNKIKSRFNTNRDKNSALSDLGSRNQHHKNIVSMQKAGSDKAPVMPRQINPDQARESAIVIGMITYLKGVRENLDYYSTIIFSDPDLIRFSEEIIWNIVENDALSIDDLTELILSPENNDKLIKLSARVSKIIYPFVYGIERMALTNEAGDESLQLEVEKTPYEQFLELCETHSKAVNFKDDIGYYRNQLSTNINEADWEDLKTAIKMARNSSDSEE